MQSKLPDFAEILESYEKEDINYSSGSSSRPKTRGYFYQQAFAWRTMKPTNGHSKLFKTS